MWGILETNSSYAFHPYFHELPHDDVGRVWSKIPLVNHTFSIGDPDWVLWMDFDTLFTNMSFTFEEFMRDVKGNYVNLQNTGQKWIDVDIIISADWYKTPLSLDCLLFGGLLSFPRGENSSLGIPRFPTIISYPCFLFLYPCLLAIALASLVNLYFQRRLQRRHNPLPQLRLVPSLPPTSLGKAQ